MDFITRFRIWYAAQPHALRLLLTINVVAYLVWQLLLMHIDVTNAFVREQLALHSSWPGVLLKPWQFITYNFLHLDSGLTGLIHIGFNMLWLVWIGRDFEQTHGAERHLAIYLLAGIGGGLLSVLFDVVSPSQYVVYGASASVLGVVATVATKYPQRRIGLLLIGNVRLVYLLIAFLALDLLMIAGSSTAVAAHFGGAITGFLFARADNQGINLSSWAGVFFRNGRTRQPASRRRATATSSGGESTLGRLEAWLAGRGGGRPAAKITSLPRREEESVDTELEVDRILEKISATGYESLTEEEKRVLYEASKK